MRTLLICHERADLDREGLARWCGSFSTFAGAVVIRERGGRTRTRIAREIGRVGVWRFLDVLAFRLYYRLAQAAGDRAWERHELQRLRAWFPDRPDAPEVVVPSPNAAEAEVFIRTQQPDLVISAGFMKLAGKHFLAEFGGVGNVAVVGDGDAAFVAVDGEGLGVEFDGVSGSRVTGVADG